MSEPAVTIGIPREIKPTERRVGLTPFGVGKLKKAGIRVLVEKGAGLGSGFSDGAYEEAGVEIVRRTGDLYEAAGLIQKVKEPSPREWDFLRPGLVLFCYLHLASPENRGLLQVLLEKKVTAIGFETVEKEGRTILLAPMSAIAGALAASFAGFFRRHLRVEGRRIHYPPRLLEKLGELAAFLPDIPERLNPGKTVVFGGGTAGRRAAETLLKMGGEVDLIEKCKERRELLAAELRPFGSRLRIWGLEDRFEERLKEAEVWLGCVHVAGEKAPWVISEDVLRDLSRGRPKLILDIAVDQGGNFPETHSTPYENPLYLDSWGNLRFAVTNIPSLCGRGASEALEEVTLPYLPPLARDWKGALREFPELRSGVHVVEGRLVHEAVARAHGFTWESLKP